MNALSPIGFGAFKIGRNEGIKYPQGYPLPDDVSVDRLLNGVIDLGINLIDTAPAYGTSEERISASVSHRRSEFFLSTKVGETFENGSSTHDFSAEGMRASVERSLRRLRTDVVDFLFLHATHDDVGVLERTDAVPTLLSMKEKGLAKAVGLSGYTAAGFQAALSWCDAIMVTYHPDETGLDCVIADAADRGIAVLVKKGLASGRLSAPDALKFILANQAVSSVVVGSLNLEHMRRNFEAAREVRS